MFASNVRTYEQVRTPARGELHVREMFTVGGEPIVRFVGVAFGSRQFLAVLRNCNTQSRKINPFLRNRNLQSRKTSQPAGRPTTGRPTGPGRAILRDCSLRFGEKTNILRVCEESNTSSNTRQPALSRFVCIYRCQVAYWSVGSFSRRHGSYHGHDSLEKPADQELTMILGFGKL